MQRQEENETNEKMDDDRLAWICKNEKPSKKKNNYEDHPTGDWNGNRIQILVFYWKKKKR